MQWRGVRVRRALLLAALVAGLISSASGASAYEAAVWHGKVVASGQHRSVAVVDVLIGRCSGTLVKPHWVLTAAHCLSDLPAAPVTIGLDSVRIRDGFGEVFTTPLHVVHPRWSFASGRNDFALLYLRRPSSLPPVALARPDDTALYRPGRPVEIVGWGSTDSAGSGGQTLRSGRTTVAPNATCERIYPRSVDGRGPIYDSRVMMCGDGVEADACHGDSGGPLFATRDNDQQVQIGVTSFGMECDFSEAGVYARVTAGRDWIFRTMAAGRPGRLRARFFAVDAPGRVERGDDVVVKGRLGRRSDGRGLIAQRVQLLRKRRGTSQWHVIDRQWTQQRGRVRFTDSPTFSGVYKLRHRRTAATFGTRSDRRLVLVR